MTVDKSSTRRYKTPVSFKTGRGGKQAIRGRS